MARIHDEDLKKLAQAYNTEGKACLYEMLMSGYGIKNPYFVFTRMKAKEESGYILEQDHFSVQFDLSGTDSVFMSIKELCTPMVPQTAKL